jgi:hypothetical protein
MMPAQPSWLQLAVAAPGARQDRIIVDVIGPFLAATVHGGAAAGGLFLREPGNPGQSRLIVQLQARGDGHDARAALGRLAADVGADPDRAVRAATVVPLAGSVFVGAALASATRDFLVRITPTLVALTASGAAGRSDRLAGALDLMAAHLPAVGRSAAPGADNVVSLLRGAPLSFLSFRSHAEAFIATSRDPVAARQALDGRFEAVREPLQQRVAAVLAQTEDRGPTVSLPASRWDAAVRAAKPTIVAHFSSGALAVQPDDVAVRLDGAGRADAFAASSFHALAGSSPQLQRYLQSDATFLAVRLLTSLLYLSLHHLGISLLERYFLCHATSRACESLFDVDPLAVLAGLSGR